MIRKSNIIWLAAILAMVLLFSGSNQGQVKAATTDVIITGVIDGPLSGGTPKAVELYVVNNVADMSIYGIESANNGGGSSGEEFTFPAVAATAGDFIYVASESPQFTAWFGFAPDYTDSSANINGDDAILLFESGIAIDVFGDPLTDGTGEVWEHTDGWAYRVDGTEAQNPFVDTDWTFSGTDALDGETTNATAVTPFPTGSYAPPGAGDSAPDVSSSSPANSATDVVVDGDITINFTEDVDVTGSWFDITCGTSGAHTAVVTGGPASYTLNPDTDFANSENCTVTVFAAQVTDVDTDDPPDNMDADAAFSFDTEAAAPPAASDLIITGLIDGPLTGGTPKGVELYVANDIADLSIYGLGSANNGGGTDGEEFTFPADSATAGDFIYVASESPQFTAWFGFAPDYTSTAMAINGDDAVELFQNGSVADIFGDINMDGTGTGWDHLDGWAYRVDGTGPDGSTFVLASWTFSGTNALDGEVDNATAATPFPVGSYAPPAPPLILTGLIDGPLTGGTPKAVELYVGQNIADLSIYGLGSANNGGGTDGEEFTFPADSATAGDYIYVASESPQFTAWFGFAPNYTSTAMAINGDDAVELFESGAVIDVFGDINQDGTGQSWEHLDGWAYRVDGTGPDGSTFVLANWTFSGPNALDGETNNATAATPFPVGSYTFGSGVDTAPTVSSSTPANGATAVSVASNIDVTFSEDVTVTGSWFEIDCTVSGAHTAAVSGGATSFTLNPDIDFGNSESCTVTVFAADVADQDGTIDNMAADHSFSFNTETLEVCGAPYTAIHDIQGSGLASALDGSVVSTEGIVTATYYDTNEMGGFFMQAADADADANPATSEGIYVFTTFYTPAVGDHVRVAGTVDEYFDLTEITSVDNVLDCGVGSSITPTEILLPVASIDDFEAYEGMLVTFPQQLTVTNNFTLGRYGEVELSVNGRLFTPTNIVAPGAAAIAQQDLNDRSRIQMDDGSSVQNPVPIPPHFNTEGTLRLGDTTDNLTAVMSFGFGAYELQPVGEVVFNGTNPRTAAPDVGGDVVVASFNVLNYFTTLDGSGAICGPLADQNCRGADTADEFTRQHDKIVDAIVSMDADVVGLIEIENHATDAALTFLVDGLNAVAGAGTYDYIPTGPIGDDAIKVAFIYQPANVNPVGTHAILDESVDPTFLDDFNRPALAQTFAEVGTGGSFTAVVNHLKSKGSDCDDIGDVDTGDGQGNCNITRTTAATALANWLLTDPTGSGDADFLIMGDLNAYAMEDPIAALTGAGYTNLVDAFNGEYSYQFFGQSGYLDHALSNAALTSQVTGVAPWHINGDEPEALNYNDFNQLELYNADPYRASDHDPIMIGLDLDGATNPSGCAVLAIDGSPFTGAATIVSYSYGHTFNAPLWAFLNGMPSDACFEIHGADSNDRILGGSYDDTFFGYDGRDLLVGRGGDDTFTGGAGRDRFKGNGGNDTVLDFELGVDKCSSIENGC